MRRLVVHACPLLLAELLKADDADGEPIRWLELTLRPASTAQVSIRLTAEEWEAVGQAMDLLRLYRDRVANR